MNLASVDQAVIDAVGCVESDHNPAALRFEPAVFARALDTAALVTVQRIMRANRCDATTAHVIYSTSWGEFQIMGENLYTICGWSGTITRYMANANQQQMDSIAAFIRVNGVNFTAADLLSDNAKLARFATVYNGPDNVAVYSVRLITALRRHEVY